MNRPWLVRLRHVTPVTREAHVNGFIRSLLVGDSPILGCPGNSRVPAA